MCGIVGVVRAGWSPVPSVEKVMADLLYFDTVRGHCGTGVALINMKNECSVFKRALPGYDFLRTIQWERAEDEVKLSRVVIGHNRASTIGSAKDVNCHPFSFQGDDSEIVLVHNGTLTNYHNVSPAKFHHEVDSAHAAAAIAQYGAEEALKRITGWYVFVWYDLKRKTFNIARNQNRDIAWCFDKGGNMWYASEWQMLDFALSRARVELAPVTKDDQAQFTSMPDHCWASWTLDKDKSDLTEYTLNDIKEEKPPSRFQGHQYQGSRREFEDDYEAGVSLIPWQAPEKPTEKTPEVILARLKAHYKMQPGDEVNVCALEWYPYTKIANKGRVEGILMFEPYTEIVIHGVEEAEWELLAPIRENLPCLVKTIANIFDVKDERLICTIDTELARDALEEELNRDADAAIPFVDTDGNAIRIIKPEVPDTVMGPSGYPISLRYFQALVKDGCANCSDPIKLDDVEKLEWLTNTIPMSVLCPTCAVDKQALLDLQKAVNGSRQVS